MDSEKIVFYDIETYPGTFSTSLSVAVTCDAKNEFKFWYEEDVHELADYLLSFESIIGYNIKHFDNAVLNQYEDGIKDKLDSKSIDMMETIENRLGYRISLQSISIPTLNISKSADGEQAIKWWLEGKKELVSNYCKDDVAITRDLYIHGLNHGEIKYESLGEIFNLKIDWHNPNKRYDPKDFTFNTITDESGKTITLDAENSEFYSAIELAKNTNRIIYLTGKAGTGKTTFLRYLKTIINKNTVVVSYTGVAALNAGGQTIHSFFQINPNDPPFIPEVDKRLRLKAPTEDTDKQTIFNYFKYNAAKKEMLKALQLLIIDEVSMLRADFVDVIDKLLRAFGPKRNEPFGGVQVILIGDLFQLSPIEGKEWTIMSQYYSSPFFFSSKVFESNPPIYVEFKKIYRQSEKDFIDLLNRIRINQPTSQDLIDLNDRRRIANITNELFEQNYLVLCSTNFQANQINYQRLLSIEGVEKTYVGEIDGRFPQNLWEKINDLNLRLKEGAQIMFLKNGKHYYNGKIGKIEKLEDDKIIASITNNVGDKITFSVEKVIWKNIEYKYNKKEKRIEQEILGTFVQYPIKLAWAITIHKSQGLTFEKVVVDIGNFSPSGLVYVALSRCTSMNGLLLTNPIPRAAINTDSRVIKFSENVTPDTLIVDIINQGKANQLYKQVLILIKESKAEEAYLTFIKALKHRNDIETKPFKRYFVLLINKFNNNKIDLASLQQKLTSCEIELKEKDKLIISLEASIKSVNQDCDDLNLKIKSIENKLQQTMNEIAIEKRKNESQQNQILKYIFEIERLSKLTWFDKLFGRK